MDITYMFIYIDNNIKQKGQIKIKGCDFSL